MPSTRNFELEKNAGANHLAAPVPYAWPTWPGRGWWGRLTGSPRAVLMLDYDGTLAPFVRERMRAVLYPGVAERLLRLAEAGFVRLVVVSGRPAREVCSLLPANLCVEVWGSHGREQLLPDGSYRVEPPTPAQAEALAWFERSVRAKNFSAAIEVKLGSIALHSRGLAGSEARRLMELAGSLFRQLPANPSAGLDWLPFDGGMEVRSSGCSKANAIERILSSEPRETPAAYLGDDLTDEDAFRALEGRGLRVLVRDELRPTAADLWLRPPGELLAFLDHWLTAGEEPGS